MPAAHAPGGWLGTADSTLDPQDGRAASDAWSTSSRGVPCQRDAYVTRATELIESGDGVLLWTGPPGMGKSFLLRHVADVARRRGADVMDLRTFAALRADGGPGRPARLAVEAAMSRVRGDVRPAEQLHPGRSRLVVLVDDLDVVVADPEMRAQLAELSAVTDPLVVLATARDSGDVASLLRSPTVVPIDPLSVPGAIELLTTDPQREVSPHVVAALVGTLGGVPGLLLESVAELSSVERRGDAVLRDPLPLTPALERTIAPRLAGLDPAGLRVLLTVGVSVTARADVILAALGTPVAELLESPAARELELVAGHIRVRDPRVRLVVHERSSLRERIAAHHDLAHACEAVGEHELATWHLALSTIEGDPRLAPALTRIATAMVGCGHAEWGVRVAREAASHADGGARTEALVALARAELMAGTPRAAHETYLRLPEDDGARPEAGLLRLLAETMSTGRVPAEGPPAPSARSFALAAVLHAERGCVVEAERVLNQAGPHGQGGQDGDELVLARTLVDVCAGAPAGLARAPEPPGGEGDGAVAHRAVSALVLAHEGRLDEAQAALAPRRGGSTGGGDNPWDQIGRSRVEEPSCTPRPTPLLRAYSGLVEVLVELRAGSVSTARALLHQLALDHPVSYLGGSMVAVLAGRLAVLCDGAPDPMTDSLERLQPFPPPGRVRVEQLRTRAIRMLLDGDPLRATALLRLVDQRSRDDVWTLWLPAVSAEEAELFTPRAQPGGLPAAAEQGPGDLVALARRARRELARRSQGGGMRQRVDDALAAAGACGSILEEGWTHVVVGKALEDDDPGGAVEHLAAAAELFVQCGASGLSRLVERLGDPPGAFGDSASWPGTDPGRPGTDGGPGPGDDGPAAGDETLGAGAPAWAACLTHREAEVARAVAVGASNKAVARDLDVSIRTVEVHLTNVYRKLGVGSRTELAVVVMTGTGSV